MGDPRQMLISILQNNAGNNPVLVNLLSKIQNNQYDEIEQIARNLCKTKGIDADQAFNQIKNQYFG